MLLHQNSRSSVDARFLSLSLLPLLLSELSLCKVVESGKNNANIEAAVLQHGMDLRKVGKEQLDAIISEIEAEKKLEDDKKSKGKH